MKTTSLRAFPLLILLGTGCAASTFEPLLPEGGPNLGVQPGGLALAWPESPQLAIERFVSSDAELGGPVVEPGTRVVIEGSIDRIEIATDDIQIAGNPDLSIGELIVREGSERVHLQRGSYGSIVFEGASAPELVITDVTLERVLVEGGEPALSVGGVRRLAIVESRVASSGGTAMLVAAAAPAFRSSDIVVVDSVIVAEEGLPLALAGVDRALVTDSWIVGGTFQSTFVDGPSDWVVFTRNTFVGHGVSIGEQDAPLGTVWFWLNRLHVLDDAVRIDPRRLDTLHLSNNTVFADDAVCVYCAPQVPDGWTVEDNLMASYRPAPKLPERP